MLFHFFSNFAIGFILSILQWTTLVASSFTKLGFVQLIGSESEPFRIKVLDLFSPHSVTCQDLPSLPHKLEDAKGIVLYNQLIVCGSNNGDETDCYALQNGIWNPKGSFQDKERYSIELTKSPFRDYGSKLFVVGGASKTTEVLTGSGWQYSTPMPVEINGHCTVLINDTAVMVLGGNQGNKTFIFNSETNDWSSGPPMLDDRQNPHCAMIKKDGQSQEKSLIVVGGRNFQNAYGDMLTTEILDQGSNQWREGPELPFRMDQATIAEDSVGGVALVSGHTIGNNSFPILRLAAADARWSEVENGLRNDQFLSFLSSAFMLPDEMTNCQKN